MRWKLEHILKKNGGGILYEDDAIIVINKPAGFLTLPDRFDQNQENLYTLLKEIFGNIFVIHRIDKDTSGIIIFARTSVAHARLSVSFERREIQKRYLAIVHGTTANNQGLINLPISEGSAGKMRIDRTAGKESLTEYIVLERFQKYTFLEVKPQTGRTHQIRIHLNAIQLPILCDPLYGDGEGFFLSSIKKGYRLKEKEELPLIKRTALHAFSLLCSHPMTGKKLEIQSRLPKDMDAVLKSLRKYKGLLQV
jgi:23S rRNA pseudouridine955/2504/2580 synthase/23S rRNA pseudouridine1911/1915/1917 synthase